MKPMKSCCLPIPLLMSAIILLLIFGCATPPPPAPKTYRTTMTVSEWPHWTEIPTNKSEFESIWKTVLDVLTEKAAINTMDKEAGYIVTEWKNAGRGDEWRYTVKIYNERKVVKYGYEIRWIATQKYFSLPDEFYNDIQSPWGMIYYPLKERLQSIK
ncbi:MAG: hypothetical protein JW984_01245 [Deltaproteobacteria bacterium]|uniref:Lipoprotein n=1 Tax=Candidatus Zymogenus saltonus TaxID=2844893 RepID=A0A9D8KCY3_9DELT|nr:hypothetical protein [Candidatus Zymogenus saltonus]